MRNLYESRLQVSCVKWFDYSYPKLKLNLFSIPNEGARTVANGARMKAQGRRAGTADMFFAKSNYQTHGLFLEFKIGKGKQSESQLAFEKAVKNEGYRYEIITDFDQFKNLIESYLL
jgi:hypothetical protein